MRRSTHIVLAVLFAGTSLLLPLLAPTEAEAYTRPGYNGKIMFIDGGIPYLKPLTDEPSQEINVSAADSWDFDITSDGDRIAFTSDRDDTWQGIYTADLVGTNLENITRLTLDMEENWLPKWSPDGTKIANISRRNSIWDIYVMNADGSNQQMIESYPNDILDFWWSPDGSRIVFTTSGFGATPRAYYSVNADGTNMQQITGDMGTHSFGSWSPDGTKIVLGSDISGNFEIYSIDVGGNNVVNLTNSAGYDNFPVWHPTNNRIYFSSERASPGSRHLFVMDSTGNNPTEIASAAERIYPYEISPDRQMILLRTLDAGNIEGFGVINIDGSGYSKLSVPGFHESIVWQRAWISTPNTPPTTANDTTSVLFNTPTSINVLANDTDEEPLNGQYLTVKTTPGHGTASVVDGKIWYSPDSGYVGLDSMTYMICDAFLLDQLCNTGEIAMSVTPGLSLVKVNGEAHSGSTNRHTTSNLRPTFSGTATPGAEVRVEIHSDPIVLTTTTDGNGNWSVTPTFDLPTGEHIVYVSATLSGMTTRIDEFGLSINPGLASTGVSWWLSMVFGIGSLGSGLYALRYATKKNL